MTYNYLRAEAVERLNFSLIQSRRSKGRSGVLIWPPKRVYEFFLHLCELIRGHVQHTFHSQILRFLLVFSSVSALTACAHNPSAPTVAPLRPPPEVCAQPPAEPVLPDSAGLVAPVTDDERAAQEAFLRWDSQILDWGRALAHRSAAWVAFCRG